MGVGELNHADGEDSGDGRLGVMGGWGSWKDAAKQGGGAKRASRSPVRRSSFPGLLGGVTAGEGGGGTRDRGGKRPLRIDLAAVRFNPG